MNTRDLRPFSHKKRSVACLFSLTKKGRVGGPCARAVRIVDGVNMGNQAAVSQWRKDD